jgi:phage shock protein PspC (stress-responsive transcriptional regulator)
MRGLGIVRANGWLGGVCGGVAARLGIDPLIVRGIVVVIAVLGGPALLLYAAGWLLLPDADGDIHLERMIAGRLEPALIGIAVLVLFSLLPFAQGFWWAGGQFWGDGSVLASLGRTLWTLIIIAVIVGVVIWAARSGRFTSDDSASRTPSHPAPSAAAPARTSWFSGTPTPGYGAMPSAGEPAAPATPGASATADELTAWRARQEAWKAEHAAWRARQAADERAVRQQRAAESRARARELTEQAEQARRRRRLANPRTSAGYVGIALGIALVASGAASALALGSDETSRFAAAIGVAAATVVIGSSIVVAGAVRRRSGFLSFIGILLVAASIACALLAPPHVSSTPSASAMQIPAASSPGN